MSEQTITKTLWSETQIEILYDAIRKQQPDGPIKEIIKDLVNRGLPPRYLVSKVEKKLGAEGAARLQRIVDGMRSKRL